MWTVARLTSSLVYVSPWPGKDEFRKFSWVLLLVMVLYLKVDTQIN